MLVLSVQLTLPSRCGVKPASATTVNIATCSSGPQYHHVRARSRNKNVVSVSTTPVIVKRFPHRKPSDAFSTHELPADRGTDLCSDSSLTLSLVPVTSASIAVGFGHPEDWRSKFLWSTIRHTTAHNGPHWTTAVRPENLFVFIYIVKVERERDSASS
jgi:hypothetical protein